MERTPEQDTRIGRRELLGSAASGVVGVVITALGVVDRVTTLTPGDTTSPVSAERLAFNVDHRLRSSLLLAIGGSLAIAPILACLLARHMERVDKSK